MRNPFLLHINSAMNDSYEFNDSVVIHCNGAYKGNGEISVYCVITKASRMTFLCKLLAWKLCIQIDRIINPDAFIIIVHGHKAFLEDRTGRGKPFIFLSTSTFLDNDPQRMKLIS